MRAAVGAAFDAASAWRQQSGPARAEYLYKWGAAIAQRQEEIAQVLTREVGKPITEARGEAARCVAILRYYAGEAGPRRRGRDSRAECARRVAVHAPAAVGGRGAHHAVEFPDRDPALEGGSGSGVWQHGGAQGGRGVVAGRVSAGGMRGGRGASRLACSTCCWSMGSEIGPLLLRDERVRGVSFTGSGRIGAQVAAIAAERNIRYQTEMGGKNVAIVLRDADLQQAAMLTAGGAMRYAGQKCTATSRVIVAREVERQVMDALRAQTEAQPI